jgi:hypothetical protein
VRDGKPLRLSYNGERHARVVLDEEE